MTSSRVVLLLLALAAVAAGGSAKAASPLPALKRQPNAQAVVNEHLAAINACDWNRLMAQFPDDVQFYLPGGKVVKGRAAVGDLFHDFVKSFKDGGLCGLHFVTEHSSKVGDTISVQWVATAPFLAAPYRGADAYITHDGLMAGQVTTFQQSEMKAK